MKKKDKAQSPLSAPSPIRKSICINHDSFLFQKDSPKFNQLKNKLSKCTIKQFRFLIDISIKLKMNKEALFLFDKMASIFSIKSYRVQDFILLDKCYTRLMTQYQNTLNKLNIFNPIELNQQYLVCIQRESNRISKLINNISNKIIMILENIKKNNQNEDIKMLCYKLMGDSIKYKSQITQNHQEKLELLNKANSLYENAYSFILSKHPNLNNYHFQVVSSFAYFLAFIMNDPIKAKKILYPYISLYQSSELCDLYRSILQNTSLIK